MAGLKDLIQGDLGLKYIHDLGEVGGGCISSSRTYSTENGKLFVKTFEQEKGKVMFEGEFESLRAMRETNTVLVPTPVKLIDYKSKKQCILIIEHLEMKSLSKFQARLGDDLARLHLHNQELLKLAAANEKKVGKADKSDAINEFGFHVPTCCGMIPQDNCWNKNWIEFFARQKLQLQIDLIQKEYQDRDLESCWSELQLELPKLFKGIDIQPALLHGDLWSGNAAETTSGPVVYDPASFYGHDEYDLAIAGMFGGFNKHFYDAYHKILPKSAGFDDRHTLYMIFHYLNHWNHFGLGYKSQAISLFNKLNRSF